MSFPRYPEYKESGVEWLGQVPRHWRIDRLKRSVKSCRNGIWGNDPTGDEDDLPCIRVADFDRVRLRAVLDQPTVRGISAQEREGRVLNRGDLLLEKSGGGELQPVGCVVLYDDDRPAVCSNFVARMQTSTDSNSSFLRYLHAGVYAARLNTRSIKQTSGIQNLDQQQYLDERAAFPNLDEQGTISDFLDRETAKVDALIAEQERLIVLLKEKRQAAISHAVTSGIDPSVSTVPSGVEFIGQLPAHWAVSKLKWQLASIEQGWSPQCESYPVTSNQEWGVLKVGCVNGGIFNPLENKALPTYMSGIPDLSLRANDLLISRANTRELVGSAAVVERDFPNLMLCDKLYRLRFSSGAVAEFVALVLQAGPAREQIELGASGASASMVNIAQSTILEMQLAIPPRAEQLAIVDQVRRWDAANADLVNEARKAIALLQERRAALISAAVTGQIDVRESPAVASVAPYTSGFARQLLAAEILTRCHQYPTTGRVKLQKLLHLCEYVAQIEEIGGSYERQAAGPFDNKLMFGVAAGLKRQKWFSESKGAQGTRYLPLPNAGSHEKYLHRWDKQLPEIRRVLTLLGHLDTERCEIVSTLYAAWNDLLIEGAEPSDEEIVRQASDPSLWHEAKAKIAAPRWSAALQWMRDHDVVPTGFGSHTRGRK